MKPTHTIIFAKAPMPGLAKTRLIPALGESGAASLAQQLLYRSLHHAQAAGIGSVEMCVTPSYDDPAWTSMQLRGQILWSNQTNGDLGDRMAQAAQRACLQHDKVLLMGTDCPSLSARQLQLASDALDSHDYVIVPAVDGGYVLLGMRQFDASLFREMVWSVDTVARETQDRIRRLGRTLQIFTPLHDIDVPADLPYLPTNWNEIVREIV